MPHFIKSSHNQILSHLHILVITFKRNGEDLGVTIEARSWTDLDSAAEELERELMKRFRKRTDLIHSTDVLQPLKRWLTNNVENARSKMARSESTRLELERSQDELCNAMSMSDIRWDDGGWETMHRYFLSHFTAIQNLTFYFGEILQYFVTHA